MMRILIISHGHPAFSIGGAEVASHNLFKALGETEHQVFYLSRTTSPVRKHSQTPLMSLRQGANEVFLHTDEWDEFWLSNGGLNDIDGAFARYIALIKPDIVHFHHVIGLGVEMIAKVRQLLPKSRIVITFHEYLPICLNHGQMIKTGRKTLCHRASPNDCSNCFPQYTPSIIFQREIFLKNHLGIADLYVSPSRFLIERYVQWGLPREKFHLIENGLDTKHASPIRSIPPDGKRNRFGFFGQVTEFKGLHILLDAIQRIPDETWNDASLSVFGGNLEFQPEAFQKTFNALLERVGQRARFYGSYRPEDLPRLMEQIDWTIMPSIWWENSPVVIQESFFHKRPLIVSDIGGMAEKVLHDVNGLQFRVSSPEDLAGCLTKTLSESGLWNRLSDNAPSPVTLKEFAEQHLALYKS